jgi:signal transduction histidine kinase/FixJ family two-component response regulator
MLAVNSQDVQILIVDDDEINLLVASRLLATLPGIAFQTATSGSEALEMAVSGNFGAILLDILMPGMDGLETAKRLHEQMGKETPPILFLTALDDTKQLSDQGFESHCVDIIFKPFDPHVLKAKLSIFAEMHRQRSLLKKNMDQVLQHAQELNEFLAGARDILNHRDFNTAVRSIFDRCKKLINAQGGYVALLSPDGQDNEFLFLDNGGLPCTAPPELPIPIRELREIAHRERRAVFDNDVAIGKGKAFMPDGRCPMENVLLAPLVLDGRAQGLLGFANKPGGFSEREVRIATTFAEFAALSLHNSQTLEHLEFINHHLAHAQASAKIASFEWSQSARRLYLSDTLPKLLELSSLNISELFETLNACVVPADRPQFKEAWEQALNGIASGATLRISTNNSIRVLHLVLGPSNTHQGTSKTIYGTFQDLTEQINSQQKALQHEKHRALGQMAGGVAHEINTPLQYLSNNLNFLQSAFEILTRPGVEPDEGLLADVPHAISDSLSGVSHIAEIVQGMLRLAQHDAPGSSLCDLNQMTRDCVALARTQANTDVAIILELAPEAPKVWCRKADISHCQFGLILNALDTMTTNNPSGHITVSTSMDEKFAYFSVHDEGGGIPESIQHRILEPFFTTKDVGEGIGMSLATIYSVIRSHHGDLTFSSIPGKETTFFMSLPLSTLT